MKNFLGGLVAAALVTGIGYGGYSTITHRQGSQVTVATGSVSAGGGKWSEVAACMTKAGLVEGREFWHDSSQPNGLAINPAVNYYSANFMRISASYVYKYGHC